MDTPRAHQTRVDADLPVNETIESLLVAGLDRYFAGDYDGAIHAWTRVLFLDRRHARARAYIERARRVLAERQRHADELAQRGAEAFQAGETAEARTLLTSAMAQGAHDEPILAMIDRIDRLNPQSMPTVSVPRRAVAPPGDLPMPRLADLVIDRARGLFERGHAHEALEALGQVPIDDAARNDADRLRAQIQATLLGSAGTGATARPPSAGARRP